MTTAEVQVFPFVVWEPERKSNPSFQRVIERYMETRNELPIKKENYNNLKIIKLILSFTR